MVDPAAARTVRRRWWWSLWGLMAVSAVGIAAVFVPPYLTGSSYAPIDRSIVGYYASLVVHAGPAGLTLIIGPLQFVPRLRTRYPRLHRIAGRVYLVSVVAASAAALYASTVSPSGFPLQVAFFLLTAAWLYTAGQAYRTIRRGEVQLHRIWMIRNYALTFAAVTLRIYLLAGLALAKVVPSLTFRDVYTAAGWAAVLGNVLVAEYVIVHRTLERSTRRWRDASAPVAVAGTAGTAASTAQRA
ncbi:DUF2306 domain-containing protein [Kitasatospora sp. NPDC059146]|uniref:DUF2306 domain-containing protein n=1 Tax=Kitasatospora sp. NPDC059146 TaxID=3346741 RepID=UPI0036BFA371